MGASCVRQLIALRIVGKSVPECLARPPGAGAPELQSQNCVIPNEGGHGNPVPGIPQSLKNSSIVKIPTNPNAERSETLSQFCANLLYLATFSWIWFVLSTLAAKRFRTVKAG